MRKITFGLLFGLGISVAASSTVKAADLPFQQFVVFGDSLSDTGNDYIASNGSVPAAPAYDTGRFTDGPTSSPSSQISGVWHEQLAAKLGIAPATPFFPSGSGTNYAFGGAETGNGFTPTPGMQLQLVSFLSNNPKPPSNALYIFWGGANDLLNATSAAALNTATSSAVQNIAGEISTLASAGAKNFLWVDLPPLNSIPRTQSSPLNSAIGTASIAFNAGEQAAIQQLQGNFPGVTITDVDVYSLFTSILANPAAAGFANTTDPAQGKNVNPDSYLFWDNQHPTTAGHQAIANLAASDLASTYDLTATPEPATAGIFILIGGIVGLVKLKRTSKNYA